MLAEAVTGPTPCFPGSLVLQQEGREILQSTCTERLALLALFCSILVCNAASFLWLAETAATNRRVARAGTSLSVYAPAPPACVGSPFELELEKRNEIALRLLAGTSLRHARYTEWRQKRPQEIQHAAGRRAPQHQEKKTRRREFNRD